MAGQLSEVRSIIERDGVFARRQHPELVGALNRLARDGEVAAVLPGVYTVTAMREHRRARLAALMLWAPEAVLIEHTAAQLSFWPTLGWTEVACALPWDRAPRPGYQFVRRRVPPELVVRRDGRLLTNPSLTALDLCATEGGDGIDRGLLTRTVTLPSLRQALELTGGRRGNLDRRALLIDSRDEPWSGAERLAHRLLRGAGIRGWRSNHPVTLEGQNYFLDIAFPHLRLVLEIDGRIHQTDKEVFENDRWRQNALVLDGWTVLRFTWRMLVEHPELVVEKVQRALAILGALEPTIDRRPRAAFPLTSIERSERREQASAGRRRGPNP